MRRIGIQVLIISFLSISIFAQDEKPKLIEEYEFIPTSHWYNFLFAIGQEYKKENPKFLIKVSGKLDNNILYPFTLGARMKAHFIANMNFNSERIQVQNCDLNNKEIKAQIFLLPENYVVPECNNEISSQKETFLFSSKYYENPYLYTDIIYEIPGEDEAVSEVYFKVLKKLLKKSPESKILLIGYLGTNFYSGGQSDNKEKNDDFEFRKIDKPKLLKEMLEENRNRLIKNGIPATLISTVDGGYKNSTRNVEIWFVPKNGEIPKLKPDYFP